MKLARIYPPNAKKGHFAQTYLLSGSGYPKFEAKRGWYEVTDEMARQLGKLLNNQQDPYSRPVFQICTPEEAEAVEHVEKEIIAEANSPIPLPKKVVTKLEKKFEDEEKWEDVVENTRRVKAPTFFETADEDDLEELEALIPQEDREPEPEHEHSGPAHNHSLDEGGEHSHDLTSAEVRSSTLPAKDPTPAKKTKKTKKSTKKSPRRKTKKRA